MYLVAVRAFSYRSGPCAVVMCTSEPSVAAGVVRRTWNSRMERSRRTDKRIVAVIGDSTPVPHTSPSP